MVDTFSKIIGLLRTGAANYRIIEHSMEGRSKEISLIRGNDPFQAMKALVVVVKGGGNEKRTILAVIPGCLRLDMKALIKTLGAQKGSFASEDTALILTGCVTGAIPPFSFNPKLKLVIDIKCAENQEIVFNAGRLDKSIFMKFEDYKKLSGGLFASISETIR